MTNPTRSTPKIAVPIRYPLGTGCSVVSPSHVIVTVSPPVSPSVVARILMIQKPSVTAGTLLRTALSLSFICESISERQRGLLNHDRDHRGRGVSSRLRQHWDLSI